MTAPLFPIPPGFRLLEVGEIVQKGDFWMQKSSPVWQEKLVVMTGLPLTDGHPSFLFRRIPAPPVSAGAPLGVASFDTPAAALSRISALELESKQANDAALTMTMRLHAVADERDLANRRVAALEGALRAARHELTLVHGTLTTDNPGSYEEAISEGCDSNAARDCQVEDSWKIDASKTLALIDAALQEGE